MSDAIVQPGWPDDLPHLCGHCGADGPRLMCVELKTADKRFALCDRCAGALSRVMSQFVVASLLPTTVDCEICGETHDVEKDCIA
jgi:hypothetical protein